jgi:hypothetical protein
VVLEAVVGDAECGEPRVEEVGVAVAVVFVGSVDGVDLVAFDELVQLGQWEVVVFEEGDEAVLEGGRGWRPALA